MRVDTRTFFRKLALFAVPFVLLASVIVVIDPYDYFGVSSAIDDDLKLKTSFKRNYAMWKLPAFDRDPHPNILLGDSRMAGLGVEDIIASGGPRYANLALGGGSLKEAISTFWFAAERIRLEDVVIGVNFNLYNANNAKDRVAEVQACLRNPLLYLCNLNVLRSAGDILGATVLGIEPGVGTPMMDEEAFWRHQLDTTTRIFYSDWKYPSAYHDGLVEIADYCGENGVRLRFVIFPGHVDLQRKVDDFALVEEEATFRKELASLAETLDFDFENELTLDRDHYRDPYHVTEEMKLRVIESIWSDDAADSAIVHRLEP